jgi:hypothetical protein
MFIEKSVTIRPLNPLPFKGKGEIENGGEASLKSSYFRKKEIKGVRLTNDTP